MRIGNFALRAALDQEKIVLAAKACMTLKDSPLTRIIRVQAEVYGAADELGGFAAWERHQSELSAAEQAFKVLLLADWYGEPDQFSLASGARSGVVLPDGMTAVQLADDWKQAIPLWACLET